MANKQIFKQRVKHYTNGYVLPFISKPNLARVPLFQSGYKALQKEQALATCFQSLLSKNAIERVEIVKSLGVLQSPVSCTKASPKVETSNRLKQAQHFSTCRNIQNGNSRVHQDLPDSRGMGIIDRPIRRQPSHPHPPKLKEIPKVLSPVAGVPVHLSSIWPGHSPSGLYNDCKESEANGPHEGTSPIPGRLADQVPVSGRSPSEHSGHGRPNPVLGVDNKSGEIRNKTNSGVFIHGLRIPSRFSPCKTHSREMAQTSDFRLKSKHVLTARCLMSLIGLFASTEKMVLERCLHMRPFEFHLKEHWRYPQSLDSLLPGTETISAHLEWWLNPTNVMKGADLHPKDHSIQLFTDASKEGWGTHLEQTSTKGLWSDREKRLQCS